MKPDTADRVLMLTGTSKGLGQGLARWFLTRGWTVAGCSRGPGTLDEARYHHSEVDVRDEQAVRSWTRGVWREFGRIDALVCNAAILPSPRTVAMLDIKALADALDTNVKGTAIACREAFPYFARQRRGRIVLIASMATAVHQPGTAAYSASKAAAVELAKVVANEGSGSGITCNVVAPSIVGTDMLTGIGEEGLKRARAELAIPRVLGVDEVAHAVEFFVADHAGAVTGQVLYMGLVR